jgi:hypothetical protein
MAEINPLATEHLLEEPKKLPETLKVLTILTFIGSGIGILSGLYSFAAAKRIYDASMAAQEKITNMPAWVKSMQGPDPVAVAQHTYDNHIPIFILNLLAVILCIVGAAQMRKLKKTGFYIYLIGELLPLVVTFIFIGLFLLSTFMLISIFLFTAVFIILYATQVKYLKN